VMLTLPSIASFNAMALVERNGWNLLWLRLRTEIRMLRFDLLHLLRIGLVRLAAHSNLGILLASRGILLPCLRIWRSCACAGCRRRGRACRIRSCFLL